MEKFKKMKIEKSFEFPFLIRRGGFSFSNSWTVPTEVGNTKFY